MVLRKVFIMRAIHLNHVTPKDDVLRGDIWMKQPRSYAVFADEHEEDLLYLETDKVGHTIFATKSDHESGRSYLDGDIDFAQQLVDEYSGTGTPICKDGKWSHRERITAREDIGTYVDVDGKETRSDRAMIIYSKTGTHIYPIRKENDDET